MPIRKHSRYGTTTPGAPGEGGAVERAAEARSEHAQRQSKLHKVLEEEKAIREKALPTEEVKKGTTAGAQAGMAIGSLLGLLLIPVTGGASAAGSAAATAGATLGGTVLGGLGGGLVGAAGGYGTGKRRAGDVSDAEILASSERARSAKEAMIRAAAASRVAQLEGEEEGSVLRMPNLGRGSAKQSVSESRVYQPGRMLT